MNTVTASVAFFVIAMAAMVNSGCRQNGVALIAERHDSGDIIVTICNCIKDSTLELPVLKTVDYSRPFDSTVWIASGIRDTIVVAFFQETKYRGYVNEFNVLPSRIGWTDWTYGGFSVKTDHPFPPQTDQLIPRQTDH